MVIYKTTKPIFLPLKIIISLTIVIDKIKMNHFNARALKALTNNCYFCSNYNTYE